MSEPTDKSPGDDAGKALRFMAIKAAIFIGIPLAAAIIAALTIVLR
jgi:hypothetical protein